MGMTSTRVRSRVQGGVDAVKKTVRVGIRQGPFDMAGTTRTRTFFSLGDSHAEVASDVDTLA